MLWSCTTRSCRVWKTALKVHPSLPPMCSSVSTHPFLDHRLQDIALHHEEKVKVRLLSTYADYKRQFGKPPTLLGQAIENYL